MNNIYITPTIANQLNSLATDKQIEYGFTIKTEKYNSQYLNMIVNKTTEIELIEGTEDSVLFSNNFYDNYFCGHIHPLFLYKNNLWPKLYDNDAIFIQSLNKYFPCTHTDLASSFFEIKLKGCFINFVVDCDGFWVYFPNKALKEYAITNNYNYSFTYDDMKNYLQDKIFTNVIKLWETKYIEKRLAKYIKNMNSILTNYLPITQWNKNNNEIQII
jgi:hypothetical protein